MASIRWPGNKLRFASPAITPAITLRYQLLNYTSFDNRGVLVVTFGSTKEQLSKTGRRCYARPGGVRQATFPLIAQSSYSAHVFYRPREPYSVKLLMENEIRSI